MDPALLPPLWPEPGAAALVVAAVLASATLRGLTGFGFALAAVPLLGLFLPPAQAVTMVILMQCMVGLRDLVAMRNVIERPALSRLSLGAAIGTPAGVALLAWLDPAAMRLAIAALVITGLVFLLRAPGSAKPAEPLKEAVPAGVLAGVFGGLAAMAGPPAVAYFLRAGTAPARARASLMVFFFFTSLMALPGLWIAGMLDARTALLSLIGMPALLIGTALGGRLFERTSETGWRRLALGVLALMALASGIRGAAGLMS